MGTRMAGALLPAGTPPVVQFLVMIAVIAAWFVGMRVWQRLAFRRRMTQALSAERPEVRDEAAALVRSNIPLVGRFGPQLPDYPANPWALTVPIAIPPLGDGRPGERFRAPASPRPDLGPAADGWRQDAQILLAPGTWMLVVCLGRVGAVRDGVVLEPASQRCQMSRASEGFAPVGEIIALDTPVGSAWRHECGTAMRFVVDTHLDRGGWAFVIGVTGPHSAHGLSGIVDSVLATWTWIDDAGRPEPETPRAALPVDPCGDAVEVVVGRPEAPLAKFRAPGPRLAVRPTVAFDGVRTEAVVPLTATAHVTVTSVALDRTAAERLAAATEPRLGRTRRPAGPVLEAATGAGRAVRRRFVDGRSVLHEAYVDHADRGWTVGLVCDADDEARLAPVFDRALATWRWFDDPLADPENPA